MPPMFKMIRNFLPNVCSILAFVLHFQYPVFFRSPIVPAENGLVECRHEWRPLSAKSDVLPPKVCHDVQPGFHSDRIRVPDLQGEVFFPFNLEMN